PVDLRPAREFGRIVLEELARVPYGEVTTYGALAAKAGRARAARAVGTVMNRNPVPIVLPCHRVVGSTGALTGYAGGLDRKRALLELEGALLRRRAPGQLSELDQELDRLAVVHGPIAVRDFVERAGAVEDEARVDLAFEDVGQQLFDVGADRRGPAAQGDVLPERDARWSRLVLGDPDPADGAAGTGDLESGNDRLLEADALQHRV